MQQDKTNTQPKANGWALIPFLVFAVFYVGLSIQANDFYKVPMPIAFLVASAAALFLGRKRKLADKIDTYCASMGDLNIMKMCLIFILSGAFATVAKGMGAVDAAVTIAQAVVPSHLMLAGMFLVSALISLSIGTSCGTIAAIVPIAAGLVPKLGINPALMIGAVVSGAMFGDNLSMISDTTIAATRTQNIPMREKFIANSRIVFPIAIISLILYGFLGHGDATLPAAPVTWNHIILVLPYILILVLALMGLNVMFLLFAGTVLACVIGILLHSFGFWDSLDLIGKGTLGMSETLIVAILAGGLLGLIRQNGGITWLMDKIGKAVHGPRGCEFGVLLLVSAVNLFTANNTVAIIIAGPVAKSLSDRFDCRPERIASILDTGSCIIQGIIPYGAQLLMAVSLSKAQGVEFSPIALISSLYYQALLVIAVIISIILTRKRTVK